MSSVERNHIQASATRLRLLSQIKQLAQTAIYGSLSESFRRCGNPGCRCHHGGPKHGPHLNISVTAEQKEKPPATMFPTTLKHKSARESRLGLSPSWNPDTERSHILPIAADCLRIRTSVRSSSAPFGCDPRANANVTQRRIVSPPLGRACE
jgi:hypothetical protein